MRKELRDKFGDIAIMLVDFEKSIKEVRRTLYAEFLNSRESCVMHRLIELERAVCKHTNKEKICKDCGKELIEEESPKNFIGYDDFVNKTKVKK